MRRRDFIKGTVGSAAVWPLTARAQQSNEIKRIGVLMPYAQDDPETSLRFTALREGLLKLGWVEGRNVRFEQRWSGSDAEAISKFAREIVDSRPDVILTDTTPMTAAVLHETRTIPVVFVQVGDPVGSGFAASFQHPGGNATGFNNFPLTLTSKWLELLMEIVPRTARVLLLVRPPDCTLRATVSRAPQRRGFVNRRASRRVTCSRAGGDRNRHRRIRTRA
jgi:putative ABC transport system substrate-binding protein